MPDEPANPRPKRVYPRLPTRIDRLPDELRSAFEREILADPRCTEADARRWLSGRGAPISEAAVGRHRRRYLRERRALNQQAAVAARAAEILRSRGLKAPPPSAARLGAEHALFRRLIATLNGGVGVSPQRLLEITREIGVYVAARRSGADG